MEDVDQVIQGALQHTELVEERPLVTFALFAYNQERFIRDAVESALAQTYSPLDIVLSDDCSTDRTYEIMSELVDGYTGPHSIKLRRNNQNLGLMRHVQVVVQEAKGELLVFAAGDDASFRERTSLTVRTWLANDQPSCVMGAICYIDDQGVPFGPRRVIVDNGEPLSQTVDRFLRGHLRVWGCAAAWHRTLFDDFPQIMDGAAEDRVLELRALLKRGVVSFSDVVVKYRAHGGNISGPAAAFVRDPLARLVRLTHMDVVCWQQHLTDLQYQSSQESLSSEVDSRYLQRCQVQKQLAQLKVAALEDFEFVDAAINRVKLQMRQLQAYRSGGAELRRWLVRRASRKWLLRSMRTPIYAVRGLQSLWQRIRTAARRAVKLD